MGLFDKLRNEFIDIIEWVDDTTDTLVWKYPRYQNEIKMNAQLTVRESQMAIFLNEGTVADIFGPGRYTLTTQNMPILTTIKGWKYGFNSPFKADVFFVSMRQFTNQKWGTKNPVMLRDAEFGPVRLRAFGNYAFKIKDPGVFLKEIASTNPAFTVEDINEQLRNLAVSRGMEAIAESKIPVLDLASNYEEVSTIIIGKIQPEFNQLGLDLTKFLIENISLPEEVEQALDKRSSIGIVGNLGAYAQYQAATSLEKSAENNNGGGLMNAGIGAGLGAAMAGQVGNIFQQNPNNNTTNSAPPPIPATTSYFVAINGQQTGPFPLNDIINQIQSKTITPTTLIWKAGFATWIAANTIDELKDHFNSTPPPIPN
ncbi:SPFH domain-containing protein [Rhizosphaericola mali]|uniref:SPFH domain-containing protein n=1 Tax=Rhizosphaericola mali TaxID=2545455 RepID=A0A5P2G1E7_9BACT|nr:SPFH domain-containing protein [Rhizosphaericola mali]QES89626.1 SPFH domain-containing protein [Rhizosphaericola mali]